uniref:Uncharacterized protein n=1 Tax=Rhinella marina erythrocytic-like virus TaxID=2859906 RepID=A0A8F6YHY1_9VIRU|nr:hypothetical protein RMELV031 [Rhinella marina erythrocytic-like virus]
MLCNLRKMSRCILYTIKDTMMKIILSFIFLIGLVKSAPIKSNTIKHDTPNSITSNHHSGYYEESTVECFDKVNKDIVIIPLAEFVKLDETKLNLECNFHYGTRHLWFKHDPKKGYTHRVTSKPSTVKWTHKH